MPELPDVEGFRRTAEKAAHRQVEAVDVRDPGVVLNSGAREFDDTLRGRRLAEPQRHGKWLEIPTEDSADGLPSLLVHFGMTGQLLWCEPDEQDHGHDRVVFRFDGGELRYRDMRKLKGVRLARERSEADEVLGQLGPDAAAVSRDELAARLTGTRRQLKSALMDQAVVAGLGNLTVDEVLWRARLAPQRGTAELTAAELKTLHERVLSTLRQASRAGLVPDRPSWLTGHRDADQGPCPRCSTELERRRVAGRTTVWCPSCQPA